MFNLPIDLIIKFNLISMIIDWIGPALGPNNGQKEAEYNFSS